MNNPIRWLLLRMHLIHDGDHARAHQLAEDNDRSLQSLIDAVGGERAVQERADRSDILRREVSSMRNTGQGGRR